MSLCNQRMYSRTGKGTGIARMSEVSKKCNIKAGREITDWRDKRMEENAYRLTEKVNSYISCLQVKISGCSFYIKHYM